MPLPYPGGDGADGGSGSHDNMRTTDEERSDENRTDKTHSIKVLNEGYSRIEEKTGDMFANCTCTLIRGHKFNIIVDTMTAWDADKLLNALLPLTPDTINYVVCTHGHSDHIGNNHLFKYAIHIVGYSMSSRERYFNVDFDKGKDLMIEPGIQVMPTPGHTATDVSVLVDTGPVGSSPTALGLVAITGDLFEREEDLTNESLWREHGGSEQPEVQLQNRARILAIADHIIPGHGPMFRNPHKSATSNAGNSSSSSEAGPSTAAN